EGVRSFACSALKGYGYVINEAINGKNAIELMKSEKLVVDLLITDLIMPEMNGKELAIQLDSIVPISKILFVSGYPFEHLAEEGKIEEGINFIQKPYSIQNLLKKIREVLDDK
ncbi:response regulator, partial [Calditrichota bacterium]